MTATHEAPLRYIDSDGHILEPPTGMLEFAPAEYRDRIWHIETDADGMEWIGLERRPQPGRRAWPARRASPTRWSSGSERCEIPYSQTRPSGWTAELRLKDLDTDGIELSVLYPTTMLGLQSQTDVEFGRVQARAYNDWCAEHLKTGQGRLFGAGALPPMHHADDVEGVVEEIRHVAELAGHGLGLHASESGHRMALLQRPGLRPDLGGPSGHRAAGRVPPVPGTRTCPGRAKA